MSEKIVNFRVEEDLKNAFEAVARKSDLTSSQMLRAFMREVVDDYMKNNAQGTLLKPEKKIPERLKGMEKNRTPYSWEKK